MKARIPLLFLALIITTGLAAQGYCSPSFLNGCFLWHNQSVTIGTINWVAGSDCTVSDFTNLSTVIEPGVAEPMSVSSGNWTGCAVWVDLDQDQSFEDDENLYYNYVGGDPSYTYDFTITLPPGTLPGSYRMRVIAPWGSDGFTPGSTNGFGPCGAFQYGNFDDFTVVVSGSTSIAPVEGTALHISPNPVTDLVTVLNDAGTPIQQVSLHSADGRLVLEKRTTHHTGPIQLDLSALPAGPYMLTGSNTTHRWTTRLVKQ